MDDNSWFTSATIPESHVNPPALNPPPAVSKQNVGAGNDDNSWFTSATIPEAHINNQLQASAPQMQSTSPAANQQTNLQTPLSSQPPKRDLGGKALHAAEVGATGLGKGAIAATPLGLAINAPTIGLDVGAAIGTIPAYGINLAMGNKAPWQSAKETARSVQKTVGEYLPNTNSMINKAVPELPQPENKLEQYIDSATQFAGGGKMLGQSVARSAGAGLASEAAGQATSGGPFEPLARVSAGAAPFARQVSQGKTQFANPMKPEETLKASSGQAQKAVKNVENAATYPGPLAENLGDNLGANSGQLVPDVRPTLGEVANDQGLAQRQNALQQKYPQPFQQAEQNRQTGMAQQLQRQTELGQPEDLGNFISSRLQDADRSAADQISAIGRYGEQPEKNVSGDVTLDARGVRKEAETKAWAFLDKVKDAPADLLTLRNTAQNVINSGNEYGAGGLHPSVQAVTKDILNPPQGAADTINTLKLFRSQISDAQSQMGLPPTAMAHLQQLKNSVDKGVENTVNGMALQDEGFYNQLLAEKEAILGKETGRQNASANMPGSSEGSGTVFSGSTGTKFSPPEQSGGAAGDTGLPQDQAPTVFGKRQSDELKNARKTTFQNRTLDDLEKSGAIQNGRINTGKFDRFNDKINNKKRMAAGQDFTSGLNAAAESQRQFEQLRDSRLGATAEQNVDPVKIVGRIFTDKSLNSAKEMHDAVAHIADDPAALNSLKGLVAKYINDNVAKAQTMPAATGGEIGHVGRPNDFQSFFGRNEKALAELYNPAELNNLRNVAAEIRRNQEYHRMANIKGQSNTNKNAMQTQESKMQTTFNHIADKLEHFASVGGAIEGFREHGIIGGIAGFAAGSTLGLIRSLIGNGIKNREMLELKMYQDPVFAKEMLQKFSGKEPNNILTQRIIRSLNPATSAVPTAAASTEDNRRKK